MEMAVRRALGYIQVGGRADGAADAAPSPARCARGRRSQAHAPTGKQNRKPKRKRGEGAASPLNRLAIAARIFRRERLSSYRVLPLLLYAVKGCAALLSIRPP